MGPGGGFFSLVVSKVMTSAGLPGKPLISSTSVVLQLKKLKPKVTCKLEAKPGPESRLLAPTPAFLREVNLRN